MPDTLKQKRSSSKFSACTAAILLLACSPDDALFKDCLCHLSDIHKTVLYSNTRHISRNDVLLLFCLLRWIWWSQQWLSRKSVQHDNLARLGLYLVFAARSQRSQSQWIKRGACEALNFARQKKCNFAKHLLHLPNIFPLKIFAVLVLPTCLFTWMHISYCFKHSFQGWKIGCLILPPKKLTIAVTFKCDTVKTDSISLFLYSTTELKEQILFSLHFIRMRRWKSPLHS